MEPLCDTNIIVIKIECSFFNNKVINNYQKVFQKYLYKINYQIFKKYSSSKSFPKRKTSVSSLTDNTDVLFKIYMLFTF